MTLPPRKRTTAEPPLATARSTPSLSFHRNSHDRHASTPLPLSQLEATLNRHRSRSTFELTSPTTADPPDSVFTPSSPPIVVSRLRKSSSSSQLVSRSSEPPVELNSPSEDEDLLYTVGARSSPNSADVGLRPRFAGANSSKLKPREKSISTGLHRGAGDTETDLDEPPRPLPTSRRLPTPPPLTPPTPLARITPLLFQVFRLLSCVPASIGAFYHISNLYQPSSNHSRFDYAVCLLWALLTAHQCLRLTTGLLIRWKTYYPPLPTLIRLLALQAICWPATQFTLVLLNHDRRPVICWAVIGSTTCVSRSIQIWVTSNLWGPSNARVEGKGNESAGVKWGARRWNWTEVGIKCALPMGVVYFVMAWAEAFRRELSGC